MTQNELLRTILSTEQPVPPKKVSAELKGLGGVRRDEFHWMRNRDDVDTLKYIEAENAYFNEIFPHVKNTSDQIFNEIKTKVLETDMSVPTAKGAFEYYGRTEEGKQYPIHCRRPRGSVDDSQEEVIIDENVLAEGREYMGMGASSVSPNHKLIAYSLDFDGSETFELKIAHTTKAYDPFDIVYDTYYGVVWSEDSNYLFYVRTDESMRPFQVYAHKVGTNSLQDTLVYEELDERFFVDLGKTSDERYIVIDCQSKRTTEQLLIPSEAPLSSPKVFLSRQEGIEYSIDTHENATYLVTNAYREDFSVVFSEVSDPYSFDDEITWVNLFELGEQDKVEGIEIFKSHIAVLLRCNAQLEIRLIRIKDLDHYQIPTPESLGTIWPANNAEYDAEVFRYGYTSFATPTSIFEISLSNYSISLLKTQPVLGDFDASNYVSERLWAQSHDGTLVPISLVKRKDLETSSPRPTLLYGYGSYEHSIDPTFSISRLSLLDRGFIFAIAHVRGGGELGRHWYEDGKLLKKTNTFYDFIACASHLVTIGYTSQDLLVARGASAGGLLMGSILNLRPDLFRTIVAEVPFVDCLTTISDPELPLTVTEWEEWGNPLTDQATYDVISSYSPYDNYTDRGVYPFLYVSAGLNDPRVSYWEPLKWVAKIRTTTPWAPIVLKVDMGAGHMGPTGRYDSWRDESSILAFIVHSVDSHYQFDGTPPKQVLKGADSAAQQP